MPDTLVVDCSVAAKWVLDEPGAADAAELLDSDRSGKVSLIAPDLLLAEFSSLLAKRVRRGLLQSTEASDAFQLMKVSAPVLFETRALIEGAFELAITTQLSVWDSVYLALAIEIDCPMITADRRLFRGHSPRHPAIRLLNSGNN